MRLQHWILQLPLDHPSKVSLNALLTPTFSPELLTLTSAAIPALDPPAASDFLCRVSLNASPICEEQCTKLSVLQFCTFQDDGLFRNSSYILLALRASQ